MTAIIKSLKRRFPVDWLFPYRSYSQDGEDMIYRSFFSNRKNYRGFYVDVGAYHPYRFSNTLYFYKKGWRGINIEPTPGTKNLFNFFRKRDININTGISTKAGELPFYCFNEPALNSFSAAAADSAAANTKYRILRVVHVPTVPLAAVLDQYLPAGQTIDFLTIDAEGFDLEVLASNNWDRYVPLFVMVEVKADIQNVAASPIYNYLAGKNYELVAKTFRTCFFKLKDS